MSRTPLPVGTRIQYLGIEATVVEDDGGHYLNVNSDLTGKHEVWKWEFEGVECEVME